MAIANQIISFLIFPERGFRNRQPVAYFQWLKFSHDEVFHKEEGLAVIGIANMKYP